MIATLLAHITGIVIVPILVPYILIHVVNWNDSTKLIDVYEWTMVQNYVVLLEWLITKSFATLQLQFW